MTVALGVLLGVGALLIASPFLWPAARDRKPRGPWRLGELLRARLVQAGLPGTSLLTAGVVSLILAVAATAMIFALVPVAALAVGAGLLGLATPSILIAWRARAGRRAQRVVWPDVVDHLVSAVRSGLALPDSVAALATNGPLATRQAFAEFEQSYRVTGNFTAALDRLKQQLTDPVGDRIIETLRMSREVGGHELTTVLRNLALYLRQDAAIRTEVEARQSWVVNAARLGVAAPWIILLLLASRPEAATAYNTTAGTAVIVLGALVSAVAYRLMLRLGRLPEERRWFQ